MNDSGIIRFTGGIASILIALFVLTANLLDYINEPMIGTVVGKILLFSAHLLLIFVFVAVYEKHKEERGFLAGTGMILGVPGSVIVSALVFLEIASASGVSVESLQELSVIKIMSLTGISLLVAAMFFLSLTIILGKVLSKWGGWLLILALIVFIAGSFETEFSVTLMIIAAAFFFGGFFLTGVTLLRNNYGTDLFIRRTI